MDGKYIKFKDTDGKWIDCIVLAILKNVGITIIKAYGNRKIKFCIHGPDSPLCKRRPKWYTEKWEYEEYEREFASVSKQIKTGLVDVDKVLESKGPTLQKIPDAFCPFGG